MYMVGIMDVDRVFPLVLPYIEASARQNSNLTAADAYMMCASRRAMLFVDDLDEPRNAMVCAFEMRSGVNTLNVLAMGGKGGENWSKLLAGVREFGRRFGAPKTRWVGRKGWQKVLPEARVIGQVYEVDN